MGGLFWEGYWVPGAWAAAGPASAAMAPVRAATRVSERVITALLQGADATVAPSTPAGSPAMKPANGVAAVGDTAKMRT